MRLFFVLVFLPILFAVGPNKIVEERLRQLGYVSGSELPTSTEGVVVHKDGTYPGVNLVISPPGQHAYLMDMQGQILHEWYGLRTKGWWRRAILHPNGDLVVICDHHKGIVKVDRHSEVIWSRTGQIHHHILPGADGGLVALMVEDKAKDENDFIVTYDALGQITSRVSLKQAVTKALGTEKRDELLDGSDEYFHTNSIQPLDGKCGFPVGHFLISMRSISLIAVVDPEIPTLTHWWDLGTRQHDAQLLPSCEVLFFDNDWKPGKHSRLVRFDSRTGEVQYEVSVPYTHGGGNVQMLPNGNLVTAITSKGIALELNPDGEVLWEWHSPWRAGDNVANLWHVERVPRPEWLKD